MDIFRQNSPARENLGLLAVMEALEGEKRITQRDLARTTGLNLKKVNYCLRKLLEKGHVKFQRAKNNPDKRGYLYILTPAGLKAKSQLTYSFLKFTLDFYNKMESKLQHCLVEMTEQGVHRVVLYGVSDVARILLELAEIKGPEITGVIDDSYDEPDFHGVPVVLNEHLHSVEWDGVLVTVLEDIKEAEARLYELGVPEKAIWILS